MEFLYKFLVHLFLPSNIFLDFFKGFILFSFVYFVIDFLKGKCIYISVSSIYLFSFIFIYPTIYLFIYSSINLLIYLTIYLSIHFFFFFLQNYSSINLSLSSHNFNQIFDGKLSTPPLIHGYTGIGQWKKNYSLSLW